MVKGTYQLLLHMLMESLHSSVWWSNGFELIDNGFTYARAQKLYYKGI